MEPKENEQVAEDLDVEEEEAEAEPEPTGTPDWEARAKKLEERAIAQRERTRLLKAEVAKLKKAHETAQKPTEPTAGDSEVEALLLEVKGITDSDEVALFEKWKADTGRNAKQVISNEIFQKELKALRDEKAVSAATPSSTKRGGSQPADLQAALVKFEQTGVLPDDFELRSAVVNALEAKDSSSKPRWHR